MNPTRHRNLYNGDCTFLFVGSLYNPRGPGAPYTAQVFHDFIDLIADSGIDTYIQNPSAQVPWYPSKALPHILTGYTRGDRDFTRGHYPPTNDTDFTPADLERRIDNDIEFLNNYQDLLDAGVDWVAEIAKACRRRNVTPWLSVRMNDLHGANSWERSYMNAPLQRDPRYRLKGREINPRDGINTLLQGLDFGHREVRDYMLAMIRELVNDYDYEGLELDWLRCPFCLEPPADQAGIDTITRWHADIRALTEARAREIGRPYPLGVRVPARLEVLRTGGIDVPRLAREGLIDFVCPSNFWQTSWDIPYDELRRQLGEGVAIYGVVEAAPNWLDALDTDTGHRGYRLLPTSEELMRGNAAGKLAMGCDGIETFNFFCGEEPDHNPAFSQRPARYPALRGLHELENLRGKPKQYVLASMHGYYMFPFYEYAEQVPCLLEPQWKKAFRLSMCAEPGSSASSTELLVQLVAERREGQSLDGGDLGVSFNGSWPTFEGAATEELLFPAGLYKRHVPEHQAFNYRLDASRIREGWNEVLVVNGRKGRADARQRQANTVNLMSVELAVRPARGG